MESIAANLHDNLVNILVADSNASIREIIRICAREEGWRVDEVGDGIAALKLLRRKSFHLTILEQELPELDGEVICSQIRKTSRMPVIFISRNLSEGERLSAFEVGGNDFLLKPFFPRELVARVKSLLFLAGVNAGQERATVTAGRITVDLNLRSVTVDDDEIKLAPREFDLLLFLCQNPSKAFSRAALLDQVWGRQFEGTDRTVDTHVKSLRNKITPCQSYISTVWGIGYKFEA